MGYIDMFSRRGLRITLRHRKYLCIDPDELVTDDLIQTAREHKGEIVKEILALAAQHNKNAAEIMPDYRFLWVATTLESFEECDPRYGYEIGRDPVYRMLDAPYYAWLRHRMEGASKAHQDGHLSDDEFTVLRNRFNAVHNWAVAHIGDQTLRRAIRTTNTKRYVPPSDSTVDAYHRTWDEARESNAKRRSTPDDPSIRQTDTQGTLFSKMPDRPIVKSVSAESKAKVDAIHDQAISLGWTEDGLYRATGDHPFPYGQDYGLICFVEPNIQIGEVTTESIELIKMHTAKNGRIIRSSTRYYNPDIKQSWMK